MKGGSSQKTVGRRNKRAYGTEPRVLTGDDAALYWVTRTDGAV